MAEISTYKAPPTLDSSKLRNKMKFAKEDDTDVFPRRMNPGHTTIRHRIGAFITSRYSEPKIHIVRNDVEIMQMIHDNGQSEDLIFKIIFNIR